MHELIKILKTLTCENRIRMLKLLLEKDICVCEMKEIFSISNSQVSRNLKMLMDAGFLKRWNEGKCVVYVTDKVTSNMYCRTMLDMVSKSFNDNKVVLEDKKKLQIVIECKMRLNKK